MSPLKVQASPQGIKKDDGETRGRGRSSVAPQRSSIGLSHNVWAPRIEEILNSTELTLSKRKEMRRAQAEKDKDKDKENNKNSKGSERRQLFQDNSDAKTILKAVLTPEPSPGKKDGRRVSCVARGDDGGEKRGSMGASNLQLTSASIVDQHTGDFHSSFRASLWGSPIEKKRQTMGNTPPSPLHPSLQSGQTQARTQEAHSGSGVLDVEHLARGTGSSMAELRERNAELEKEVMGLTESLQLFQARVRGLEMERDGACEAAVRGVDALSASLSEARGERDALSGSLSKRLETVELERDAVSSERDALSEKLARTELERDAAVAQRDTAIGERDAIEAERDALSGERDALEAERDALRGERDAIEAERDAIEAEGDALRKENSGLFQGGSDFASLRGEVDSLSSSLDEARQQRDALLEERDKAVKESGELSASLAGAREEVEQITVYLSSVEGERDALSSSIQEISREKADLEASLNEIVSEKAELSASLIVSEKERDALEKFGHQRREIEPRSSRRSSIWNTLSIQSDVSAGRDERAAIRGLCLWGLFALVTAIIRRSAPMNRSARMWRFAARGSGGASFAWLAFSCWMAGRACGRRRIVV